MVEVKAYDVVIVGAGVAGLNAAYELGRKGFRVAIIESKPREKIGDKTCGDAIGVHHFREIGWNPPDDVLDHRYDGVKVYSPSEEHSITVPGEGVSVNRVKFGQWLMKRAVDHGVELYDKHWLTHVNIKDDYVESVEAREAGSLKPVTLKAKVFIDASGAKPALRSKLPHEWPLADRPYMSDYNIAYREVIRLEKPLDKDVEYAIIYLNTKVAPGGYWWFFPKNRDGSIVNVGLGVIWGVGDYNPRHNYERYLRKRFKGEIIHRGGGLVPTRRPLPTLVWRNVVVIGDAAYTVNPVHGGGIGSSMLSAYIASKHIIEALEKGVVNEDSMWGMNIEYIKAYGAKQAGLDILRMYLQKLSNDDFEWLFKNRIVDSRSIYDIGYRGSLTEEVLSNIRRMLRLLAKPSLLNKLRTVKKYMDQITKLYSEEYPEKPNELMKWVSRVEELVDTYRRLIGYEPGEKVKW